MSIYSRQNTKPVLLYIPPTTLFSSGFKQCQRKQRKQQLFGYSYGSKTYTYFGEWKRKKKWWKDNRTAQRETLFSHTWTNQSNLIQTYHCRVQGGLCTVWTVRRMKFKADHLSVNIPCAHADIFLFKCSNQWPGVKPTLTCQTCIWRLMEENWYNNTDKETWNCLGLNTLSFYLA